ncbi:MAG TPA: hypothetical protein DCP74_14855 [Bacteroidales bacterium]|nr:MAG: hypothetical protein A2X06_00450 [Bacteroidetes bacterium GWC2_40_22]HAM11506.1 hypothetical protein [Bacteroidales bacterium]HBQ82628.1 hypothetical protein [Bacteroidales bacterium]HCT83799.1 hypothetical protein [Candidatus Margulisiibacteriota bacterium]
MASDRFEVDYFVTGEVAIAWMLFMIFPAISIVTSYFIYHKENAYISKTAKFVFYSYPVIVVLSVFGLINLSNMLIIVIIISVILFLLTIVALIHLNVFTDATGLTSTIIFTVLIIISILLKRYHIIYSGLVITMVLALFLIGSFIFGIRCLYLGERNKYFKNVTFWGSFIITLMFMGLLWKLMHWPGGNLIITTSNILLPLATVIFLLTLPSSGYTEWKPLHKKIIIRLLIPWTLIFMLFLFRFLLPEVHNIIWNKDVTIVNYGFDMPDYTIELKGNPDE